MPAIDRRLAAGWATALALHAVVAAWSTARTLPSVPPPRRAVDVALISPPSPPPPPAAPAAVPPAPPPAKTAAPARIVDARRQVADTQPPPADAAAEAAPDAKPVFGLGQASFSDHGSVAMRRGNTVGMAAADSPFTADEVAALGAVAVYSVTALPRILTQPQPVYPAAMRGAGIEGEVVLDVVVAADGSVAAARVVEATHPDFVAAALEAVRATTFAPGRQGSTAVAVRIRLPVKFRLR